MKNEYRPAVFTAIKTIISQAYSIRQYYWRFMLSIEDETGL
jgi:hypothetical protein